MTPPTRGSVSAHWALRCRVLFVSPDSLPLQAPPPEAPPPRRPRPVRCAAGRRRLEPGASSANGGRGSRARGTQLTGCAEVSAGREKEGQRRRGWPRGCRWATPGTRGGRGDRGLRHGWRGTRWGGAALVTVPAASRGAIEVGLLGCHGNRRVHGAWSGPGELHLKAGWPRVAWPRGLPGAIRVPSLVAEEPFQASVYLVVPWRCNLTRNISKELQGGSPALSN